MGGVCVAFRLAQCPCRLIVSSIIIEVLLIAALFVMANMINGCFMMCALSVAAPSMAFLA